MIASTIPVQVETVVITKNNGNDNTFTFGKYLNDEIRTARV